MKTYQFEYTDQRYTFILFALSFLSLVVIVFTSGYTAPLIGIVPVILIGFAVAAAIFILNKKKIKQSGLVNIADTYVEFKLATSTKRIEYVDIAKYEFKKFYTGRFFIKLKSGEKFLRVANPNFCKPENLIGVSVLLDKSINRN